MGLLDRFKKHQKPTNQKSGVDPRLVEKIMTSDLWEYRAKRHNVLGNNKQDLYFGSKKPSELISRFITELGASNSGIVSRHTFANSGFSESEINAIFGNSAIRLGFSNPNRCVKDKVWEFMCFRESARLSWLNDNAKLAQEIGMVMKSTYESEKKWLDWGKAIREFWKDEPLKDYRSYIITN